MTRTGLLAVALAAAYDVLFWDQSPGLGGGTAATITLAALAVAPTRRWSRAAIGLLALLLPLCLLAAWGGRPMLTPLLIVLLLSMLAATLKWGPSSMLGLLGEGLLALVLGWLAGPLRWLEETYGPDRAPRPAAAPRFAWIDLAIPAGLVLVFGSLLFSANPVLETLGLRYWGRMSDWFVGVTPPRVLFWLGSALLTIGWLAPRHRLSDFFPPVGASAAPLALPWDARRELSTALWSLGLLNALFLVHNLTEGLYLWGGRRPPQGAGYLDWAEYARAGSYQLMAAVLLAGLVLCVLLRLRGPGIQSAAARALAYLWLAQNLLVVASAARRLALHVEAYGLSHLRLNGAIWLALVVVGYVFLMAKIARHRPLRWLVTRCALASFLALYASCWLDADALIARWNLEPAHRAAMIELDTRYLFRLGDGAYPHLAALLTDEDPGLRAQARERLENRLGRLKASLDRGWPSWTWRRERVRDQIEVALSHQPLPR